MGLLSLFQRKPSPPLAPADQPGDEVQRARSRARQRLIGAVVLVGIGIVGFPLLFETHPRPIPVDLPIEIANKDRAPPLVLPPARPAGTTASAPASPVASAAAPDKTNAGSVTESAADSSRDVPAPASKPAVAAEPKPEPSTSPKPAAKPTGNGAPSARSAPDGQAVAKAPNAEGRFALQVGAFAEAATARETRQRVEKLGLKTYTQTVETQAGNRIRVRVGPFASREEADRAAGKLKSAGLPAALLAL